ncbi:MAG: helix-turn-helix transcriptional regulator [Clostridia bacterium]|nr:helix-turn-helix transcriptional regulator [Clostridia bacterium]
MNIFGKRLSELRQEEGITRADMAKRLNISVRLISYWENGERECSFDMLIKLADMLNTSTDYLLGRKDY